MKKTVFTILILAFLLSVKTLAAETYSCAKWQVLDITIKSKKQVNQPLEAVFGAYFIHSSGTSMQVPGFYNDQNTWILRFCPELEGSWTYTTYSSLSQLAGNEGSIEVSPSTKSDEHGPLTISAKDKSKFVYADGSPYFLMAFELDWLFALDHDNPDDIPKTRQMVSQLVDNGFNQVVMNVYAYDASWGDRESIQPEYNFAEPEVYPFGGSNEEPDFSTLNIDFFKHLDRVIGHLDEQEIIAHLMIYVWNKKVSWPEPGSSEDNMYFDYVVKRYQAYPNLVWDISKEALAYGRDDLGYITERIERLRKLDAYDRLLSVHDYGYCRTYPGKVDFISVQAWSFDIHNNTREIIERHPGMPVFNIEHGGYEKSMHSIFDGSYTDAITCLDRNYQIIFAGAYSTYYWQNSSWYEVVYEPGKLSQENQPRFEYYKHLTGLFQDYNFNKLQHFKSSVATYILSDGDSLFMFYCPREMIAISGSLPELKEKKYGIKWFNPLSGEYIDAGKLEMGSNTWLGMKKPDALKNQLAIAILELNH